MFRGAKQAVHCLQDYVYVEEEFSSNEDDDNPRETFQQKRDYFQKMGEHLPLWECHTLLPSWHAQVFLSPCLEFSESLQELLLMCVLSLGFSFS